MAALAGGLTLAVFGFVESLGERAGEYGYLAVLLVVAGDGVFPILPGETAIVTGAVFAADGQLSLTGIIVAGTVGAMIGDSCAYWIGRTGGASIRRFVGRIAGPQRLAAAEGLVARQGPALVFAGRFLPGFRIAVNMSCGAGHMAYRRFLLFDGLGAIVWSAQAAILGFVAGKAFAGQIWLALVVAIGVALVVGAVIARRERKRLRLERLAEKADPAPDGADAPPPAATEPR